MLPPTELKMMELEDPTTTTGGSAVSTPAPPAPAELAEEPAQPDVVEEPAPLVGMTTLDEQAYYAECVRQLPSDPAAIVDLGCWMGSTSVSLARGLKERVDIQNAKVWALDRFIWEDWMSNLGIETSCDYVSEESFLPEARRRVREYADLVELQKVDLSTYEWNSGPISLLLVDAMKDADLSRQIALTFYPDLVQGSCLIHQDYKFIIPWIHVIQYRLRDYFKFTHEVLVGYTARFETLKTIPKDVVEQAVDFDSVSDDEIVEAIEYAKSHLSESGKNEVVGAHVMHYVYNEDAVKGREMYDKYVADGITGSVALDVAKGLLEELEAK